MGDHKRANRGPFPPVGRPDRWMEPMTAHRALRIAYHSGSEINKTGIVGVSNRADLCFTGTRSYPEYGRRRMSPFASARCVGYSELSPD